MGGWDGGREGGGVCVREIPWERHSVTGGVRMPGECVRVHACVCGTPLPRRREGYAPKSHRKFESPSALNQAYQRDCVGEGVAQVKRLQLAAEEDEALVATLLKLSCQMVSIISEAR